MEKGGNEWGCGSFPLLFINSLPTAHFLLLSSSFSVASPSLIAPLAPRLPSPFLPHPHPTPPHQVCSGINALSRTSDRETSSSSLAAMVASGSATATMHQCVTICASAVVALATVAAVLARAPVTGTVSSPTHIGEGGGEGGVGDQDPSLHIGPFVLEPTVLLALVIGCSYPAALTSMSLQAAGKVASSVISESECQLTRSPEILDPYGLPLVFPRR